LPSGTGPALQELRARNMSCEHENTYTKTEIRISRCPAEVNGLGRERDKFWVKSR
jgi:hypothetical protein